MIHPLPRDTNSLHICILLVSLMSDYRWSEQWNLKPKNSFHIVMLSLRRAERYLAVVSFYTSDIH